MLKAVIIGDEYIVIEGLKLTIEWKSYGIEIAGEAANGNEGLELIKKVMPDIVLTDIRIPGIDGITLIESAKKIVPATFFVIFNGYRSFEYAKKAISMGVVDYIEKPVTVSKMDEALKKICSLHQTKIEYEFMKKQLKQHGIENYDCAEPNAARRVTHKMIAKAKEYLENNFTGDISLADLAKIAQMNPAYFSLMFKNETGVNYIKYLNTLRMEKSIILLRQGLKVKEAAKEAGYTNTRYFCDIFKKTYNVTPEQFKKL